MDPERQPLLPRSRCRKLTFDEVARYQAAVPWRRARLSSLLLLWALLAAAGALLARALSSPGCHVPGAAPAPRHSPALAPAPAVPPVLMSMAPLVAAVREQYQKQYIL